MVEFSCYRTSFDITSLELRFVLSFPSRSPRRRDPAACRGRLCRGESAFPLLGIAFSLLLLPRLRRMFYLPADPVTVAWRCHRGGRCRERGVFLQRSGKGGHRQCQTSCAQRWRGFFTCIPFLLPELGARCRFVPWLLMTASLRARQGLL